MIWIATITISNFQALHLVKYHVFNRIWGLLIYSLVITQYFSIKLQWNLSKSNLCVRNKHIFSLDRLTNWQRSPTFGFYLMFSLHRVQHRQVSLYLNLNNGIRVMVFNATFNNISGILWQSVLLVEETRVPWENHWPSTSHWQTLPHNVVSSTPRLSGVRTRNVSGDR